MGRVWKARDLMLHRDVAIKELVPPPGLTEDERRQMRERSLREARAIARLNHVNVIRIFDVLRTDGDPWIVMEYVPSRSLQDVLAKDGPLPPVRVAEIGLGVLGALRAAHRAGVVHRDVKPGNVLLGLVPEGVEAKPRIVLTDFGLATVPGDPAVTRTGLVLGSPAYIAPERARDGTAGPESDLWSLGATLYAAVEGQPPYARPSAMATLAALATEPVPPPKRAGPLKPVLMGLLRKDPASRISAEEAELLLRRVAGRRARRLFLTGTRRTGSLAIRPAPSDVGPRRPSQGPAKSAGRAPALPRRWLIAAPVVSLAAAVLVPLAIRGDRGDSTSAKDTPQTAATTGASPTAAAPGTTAATSSPSPSASGDTSALPSGWRMHHDPTGFSVPVPEGWRITRERYGSAPDEVRVYFQDPRDGRMLLIDQTDSPKPDPVADWRRQEAARRSSYRGYRRIKIEAVDYWVKAADWEWTYNLNGVRMHVRNRGFITAPDKAYGMYWRTPEAVWEENLAAFDIIARGFRPARN